MKTKIFILLSSIATFCCNIFAESNYCQSEMASNGTGDKKIYLTCQQLSPNNYQIKIEADENLTGLGGSYCNINGATPHQLNAAGNFTIVDNKTIVCNITSTTAPVVYTPLFVIFANGGERVFTFPNNVVWDLCAAAPDDDVPPTMGNANPVSTTHNSAVIAVAATDNITNPVTKFMVSINGAGATQYTAVDGKITINSLEPLTQYNLEIWAKDAAGNVSDNSIEVQIFTTSFTGACSGDVGHFGAPQNTKIHYEIEYLSNEIIYTVTSLNAADPLEFLEVQTTIGNIAATIVGGTATVTQSTTAAGTLIGIRFLYKLQSMPGNEMNSETININSPGIVLYEIGQCTGGTTPTDNTPPVMSSATQESTTHNSAVIAVSATDDVTNPVTIFIVSVNDGENSQYTAVDGKITINSLEPLTQYNLEIWAKDAAGNVSDNSIKVPVFTTSFTGACSGDVGHFGTPENVKIHYEIEYSASKIKYTVTSLNDTDPLLNLSVQTTIGSVAATVNEGTAVAEQSVEIEGMLIGIRFLYQLQSMAGNEMNSEELNINSPNIILYEIGQCAVIIEPDVTPPVMEAAEINGEAGATSAIIEVEATDDITSPVTTFTVSINSGAFVQYTATDGKITLENLTPNTDYTVEIKAKDEAGNVSANSKTVIFKTAASTSSVETVNFGSTDIFPTVFADNINIFSQNTISSIIIYDILGQSVFEKSETGSNFTLNLTNLRSGTYFVLLTDEKGSQLCRKIIKK